MSKSTRTDTQLINSKRSLLELQKIKQDKADESESNIIFSQNTEADNHSYSSDMEPYESCKLPFQQKQLLKTFINHRLESVWLFVLNGTINEQNTQRIKKIYLCQKSYKQAKIILPIFKFTQQCKKFKEKLSQSSPSLRYKVIADSYNAIDVVEEFKNNPNVTEIYLYNDIKQEGLDQILPLKKKTNKIVGVYNSLLSLIIKAEKQIDYQIGFIQRREDDGKQAIIPVYPNRFVQFALIPDPFNSEQKNQVLQFNDFIAKSIGLPIQDKKNQVQKFFSHLKVKLIDNDHLIETLQKLEDLNHISPIVNEQRAQQMLLLYLGLDTEVDTQNEQKDRENTDKSLFNQISTSLQEKKSLNNLQLGVNQIFHCIRQLSNLNIQEPAESQSFPQNPNIPTIDPQKSIQVQVLIQDKIKTNIKAHLVVHEYCYKFFVFPVEHVGKMVDKFIQIQDFCEFYTDIKTAERNFNLNHTLFKSKRNQPTQKFTEMMYNKVCLKLKLPTTLTKSNQEQSFIIDYGILQLEHVCHRSAISIPDRWKSVCLLNIMSVFKVQKVQIINVNPKLTVYTLCLETTSFQNIFQSDPNYLSIHQLKILNFYKRTNIFKALNGNYRQLARSKVKRDFRNFNTTNNVQNLLKVSSLEKTQKIKVRSYLSQKHLYMKSVLQITQNSSKVGPLPIQQLNLQNINFHIEALKEKYILVGSRHESLKKKITRRKQNQVSKEQSSYHNQKLLAMIEQLYRFDEELYEIKLQLQDYHVCSYHLQNMETLLIKYPILNGQFGLKEIDIVVRRVEVELRKGNIIEARKEISQILQPLYQTIEKQQAEAMSICSGKYFRYVICSCWQSRGQKYQQVVKLIGSFNEQCLEDLLAVLNVIGQLVLIEQRIRHYFGVQGQQSDDMIRVIGKYLSQKLIKWLERTEEINSQNIRLLAQYNRLIGLFQFENDKKLIYYLKAIEMLQKKQPFNLKSATYFEQLGNSLKQQLISNKLTINRPLNSLCIFAQHVNQCLQFYERAIGILECHKSTQIEVIRNINSILQLLLSLNQLELLNQYINDKIAPILTKHNKSTAFRSQLARSYYILSLKAQIQGHFKTSINMIHKSLNQLQNSLLKQNISTYQIILKLSTPYFMYKLQQIKLSILTDKFSENNLQDLKWLKKVYDQHYILKTAPASYKCQLYRRFLQIQALYWLHKRSLKNYYKFTFKQVLAIMDSTKNQQNATNHIAFNKLCILTMKFLANQKIFDTLMRKIQLTYYQAVKIQSNKAQSSKYPHPNDSFSKIQPSFVSSQFVKMGSTSSFQYTATENWQFLYWKYHFIKGLYFKTTKNYQSSLKSLRKAIILAKSSRLNNQRIQLKIYQRTKEQLEKMQKSTVKVSENKKYTILVYEVELKYIVSVIECISMKIPLNKEDVEECQNYMNETFSIINQMISVSDGDIPEVEMNDFSQNRIFEIGSQIIKHLTVHKFLNFKQKKSIQQQIKFYSTGQNLSLTLRQIFQPIYQEVQSRQHERNPEQTQQDQMLFKQILTNPILFSQQLQNDLQKLNQQVGVNSSKQSDDEMFQRIMPTN